MLNGPLEDKLMLLNSINYFYSIIPNIQNDIFSDKIYNLDEIRVSNNEVNKLLSLINYSNNHYDKSGINLLFRMFLKDKLDSNDIFYSYLINSKVIGVLIDIMYHNIKSEYTSIFGNVDNITKDVPTLLMMIERAIDISSRNLINNYNNYRNEYEYIKNNNEGLIREHDREIGSEFYIENEAYFNDPYFVIPIKKTPLNLHYVKFFEKYSEDSIRLFKIEKENVINRMRKLANRYGFDKMKYVLNMISFQEAKIDKDIQYMLGDEKEYINKREISNMKNYYKSIVHSIIETKYNMDNL